MSYKETCDKIGEEELKARVAAGTIQHRKNPEDRRFFQFKLHKAWCCAKFITADSGSHAVSHCQETEDTTTSRRTGSRAQAKADATLQDIVSFDNPPLRTST